MRLEIGSGYAPTPGFVHLDANPNAPDVDIVGPAFPLCRGFADPIPDESVTELRAVDVLEHISYRDTDTALAEWARVLAPGGRAYIQVPDAATIMWQFCEEWSIGEDGLLRDRWLVPPDLEPTPINAAQWRLLGGHADGERVHKGDDWRLNAHYSLWGSEDLAGALKRAGLQVQSMDTNRHPNLCCWAVKP